ncbi:MAG TPA: tyrosine-type recombinase/integrase [Kiritimatiellia bacterium]|nr:tyrosine-type recombinase/integrase [Kiritimatiellia bacterium]HRZ12303.1 tyrosine-type recombinase/integrase [Kiritimatiellia bacterium]HSA17939.1 tyrosine-type recombinase/integrase [Kiritimatiellia bacterium]
MASIHKLPNCKNWFVQLTNADGKRTFRATHTADRKLARKLADKYDEAARQARARRLTEATARKFIKECYELANLEPLQSDTVRAYAEAWLKRKESELADSSLREYKKTVDHLAASLGKRFERPMDTISRQDAARFRDSLTSRVSGSTTNKYLKIARVLWGSAQRDGLTLDNPFALTPTVRASKGKRRPFTLAELKRILEVCNQEWRGMVLLGLYTGQRIGDLARLTWANTDTVNGEIYFTTGKTGRAMNIPIAAPLMRYFEGLAAPDEPDAPLFPNLVKQPSSTLSKGFRSVLGSAGLAEYSASHDGTGKGRDSKRDNGGLSFHCLRHTATSLLKNAGVGEAVAMEIVGHNSAAVSQRYTHIETSVLREAVNKLPDVTR